jgi:hypothetical protein
VLDASLMPWRNAAGRDLLKDIECYICGEEPSPLTMLRVPRLENWSADVRRRGKAFVLIVSGEVRSHENAYDIARAAVWFDRHHRWVRTSTRLFALGEPAGDPDRRNRRLREVKTS